MKTKKEIQKSLNHIIDLAYGKGFPHSATSLKLLYIDFADWVFRK